MKCPKCGFVQPISPECLSCGIIFERYRPDEERQQAAPDASSPAPAVASDPFRRPIRPALRVVRSLAGLVGLVVGGWLFLAGQQLDLQPHHVLFLIGYGCVSLFWVLSAPIRVSVRQFAVEMLVFVFATVLLKVALPEAFELGTTSNRQAAPLHAGQGAGADLGAAAFVERLEPLVAQARAVLDAPGDGTRLSVWQNESEALRRAFRTMPPERRKEIEALYRGLVALDSRIELATTPGADASATDAAFIAIEQLENDLVSFQ